MNLLKKGKEGAKDSRKADKPGTFAFSMFCNRYFGFPFYL